MPEPSPDLNQSSNANEERTKQVTVAGYTAGTSVFFLALVIGSEPTWPAAFAVAALAAMVAVVCYHILKRP